MRRGRANVRPESPTSHPDFFAVTPAPVRHPGLFSVTPAESLPRTRSGAGAQSRPGHRYAEINQNEPNRRSVFRGALAPRNPTWRTTQICANEPNSATAFAADVDICRAQREVDICRERRDVDICHARIRVTDFCANEANLSMLPTPFRRVLRDPKQSEEERVTLRHQNEPNYRIT